MSVQSKGVRFPNRVGLVGLAWASILACGCSLDSGGLGDLFESAGDDGGPTTDATFTQTGDGKVNGGDDTGSGDDATTGSGDSSNGNDAGDDAGPPIDTGTDTCASNVEICNNGIDDNCNGLIDCADPACGPASWTCTHQVVPAGWTVVEYASGATPPTTCGGGYTAGSSVYEGPFPNAMCTCACNVTTSGSCENGSFEYALSDQNGNCTVTGVPDPDTAGNGSCQAIGGAGYPTTSSTKEKIAPIAYTPGACTASANTTKPPIPENGHVCAETTSAGAGCANSGACVPAVQAGYSLCIQSPSGSAPACPTGFTNVHDVGTGFTDTRGCSSCNCTGPTAECANPMVTLFTDPNGTCGDGGTGTVKADNGCDAINLGPGTTANPTFHGYEYSATVTGEACGGSGSATPNGGVTLTGAGTICCQ